MATPSDPSAIQVYAAGSLRHVLVQAPKLMILDEPTAHLDFANQARFLSLTRRLAKAGLAVIFTTHAPDHAFSLADQTLILSPNHSPSLGATKDILTETMLSRTYGVPIRLIGAGDHVACVAEVD
ncbi:ABC transporter ATP-binding protein [Mesorhizobium loti]|nr:ABC transporter ATP-binding protein [Mesorhizobium loti]